MSTLTAPAMQTISLAELDAQSALLNRVDRKYLLPAGDLPGLVERLPEEIRVLEIDGLSWFGYRSVYFDTPELANYHAAGHGRRRRFKARTRDYLDSGSNWLEVKTRGPRGITIKDRITRAGDRPGLSGSDREWIAHTLHTRGIEHANPWRLTESLVTSFRRRTLQLPASEQAPSSRVTIDVQLSCELPASAPGGELAIDLDRFVIVETKGSARASAIDHLLFAMGHRPTTVSKYGLGIAALRIDQPALKWHGLINRRLAAA